jgi:ArsR family transcriptional regulator
MQRTLAKVSYSPEERQLAAFAKALGHPVRVQILNILNSQPCCFTGDLTDMLPLAQSTISQHLKALKDAELIQGMIEPPKVRYCLNRENWAKAQELFATFLKL